LNLGVDNSYLTKHQACHVCVCHAQPAQCSSSTALSPTGTGHPSHPRSISPLQSCIQLIQTLMHTPKQQRTMAGQWNNGAISPSGGADRKGRNPSYKNDNDDKHVTHATGLHSALHSCIQPFQLLMHTQLHRPACKNPAAKRMHQHDKVDKLDTHVKHYGRWAIPICVGVGFHTLVRSSAISKFLKSTAHICSLSPATKHSELIRPTRQYESREVCGCFLNPLSEGFGKCGVVDVEHGDGVRPGVAPASRGEMKDNGTMAPSTHPVAGGRGIVLRLSLSGICKAMVAIVIKDFCGGIRRGLPKCFCSSSLIYKCASPPHPTGFNSGTQILACRTLAGHLYVRPKNSTIYHLEQIGSKLNGKVSTVISRLRLRSGILCYRLKSGFATCLGLSLESTGKVWPPPPWSHRVSVKAAKAYHFVIGTPWRWGQNISRTTHKKQNGACPPGLRTGGSVLNLWLDGLRFGTEGCTA